MVADQPQTADLEDNADKVVCQVADAPPLVVPMTSDVSPEMYHQRYSTVAVAPVGVITMAPVVTEPAPEREPVARELFARAEKPGPMLSNT